MQGGQIGRIFDEAINFIPGGSGMVSTNIHAAIIEAFNAAVGADTWAETLSNGNSTGSNNALWSNGTEARFRSSANRVFSPSTDVLRLEGNLTTEVGKDGDIIMGVSLTGLNLYPATDKAFNVGRTGNRINNTFIGGYVELSTQADPGAVAANTIRVGSQDATVDAVLSTLHLRTEQSAIVDASFVETHKLAIWHNGTQYYIALEAV